MAAFATLVTTFVATSFIASSALADPYLSGDAKNRRVGEYDFFHDQTYKFTRSFASSNCSSMGLEYRLPTPQDAQLIPKDLSSILDAPANGDATLHWIDGKVKELKGRGSDHGKMVCLRKASEAFQEKPGVADRILKMSRPDLAKELKLTAARGKDSTESDSCVNLCYSKSLLKDRGNGSVCISNDRYMRCINEKNSVKEPYKLCDSDWRKLLAEAGKPESRRLSLSELQDVVRGQTNGYCIQASGGD